ncbi:MAG TPA: hypothetical protein VFQ60_00415, partial [Patescibacteria group bacterium]|nr:hypothetical protein [Patescibacteria group bacterium]
RPNADLVCTLPRDWVVFAIFDRAKKNILINSRFLEAGSRQLNQAISSQIKAHPFPEAGSRRKIKINNRRAKGKE